MRKSVYVAVAAGLSAMLGCVKGEYPDYEQNGQDVIEIPFTFSCEDYSLKTASPSSADESKINWVDVFVSVDGGEFCRHRVVPGSESSISVRKGTSYLLGAVANAASHTWDCNDLVSVFNGATSFKSSLYRLSENYLDSFVMMTDRFQNYDGEKVHFELKRRVNKCTVRSIRNMWGDPDVFEIVEIYLADVLESSSNNPYEEKFFYNHGGYKPSSVDHLLYAGIGREMHYGETLQLDESLYYLSLHGSGNYLVVNALADGEPMSYSLKLPSSLDYNTHYAYDLVISHAGDEDMIPDSGGSIVVDDISGVFEVVGWNENSESRGF